MDASVQSATTRSVRASSSRLSGLRVALVHDWLTGMRGGEKCLEVLCQAFPDATLHTLIHRKGALSPTIEAMKIKTSHLQRIPGVLQHYRKLLPLMPLAARSWKIKDADIVISLSHCVAKAVRPPRGVPHVCYCFTPMRYAWQGRDAYLDDWRDRPLKRAAAGIILNQMRRWDLKTSSRVSHFISISETIKRRITDFYGRDSRVIYPPVDTAYYTPDDGPRNNAYLCVSALVPYKRLEQAIAACTQSGRELIIIGKGTEERRLQSLAGPTVKFLGWQPDDVIREHYRRCRALIFPGNEDFGIVPIEALACGMPVIALGQGGVAETIDDQVGRTYPEQTTECLLGALNAWEAAGCPYDIEVARQRAESLSLPIYRERLLGMLNEVLYGPSTGTVPPAPHVALPRPSSVDEPR